MEEKISALFFGLDSNQMPSEIVKQSNLDFEDYIRKIPGIDINQFSTTTYAAGFNSHPFFLSKIKEGRFDINHNTQDEQHGIFHLILVIHFTNEADQINEYDRLISEFRDYGSKTEVESTKRKNHTLESQVTTYQNEMNYEFPKLSFYFSQAEKNVYPIVIDFVTSWKREEMKKFLDEKRKE